MDRNSCTLIRESLIRLWRMNLNKKVFLLPGAKNFKPEKHNVLVGRIRLADNKKYKFIYIFVGKTDIRCTVGNGSAFDYVHNRPISMKEAIDENWDLIPEHIKNELVFHLDIIRDEN